AVEEGVAEEPDFRGRRRGERGVRPHQRPAGEEADMRTQRRAVQRVRGAGVVEVTRQPDERVRHEGDRDRREEERERNRSPDEARRRDAVERHRGRRRHDPDREGNRLPETQLAPELSVRSLVSRLVRNRRHYVSPFSKMVSGRNIPTTQFGASTTSWMRRSPATE